DTCRLGRDGRPGERLRVSIAGPGSLFRIRALGPGADAGTTVRLYLRPDGEPPSCVTVLREVLWAADFDTRASKGTEEQHWPAGALADSALRGRAGDDDDDDDEDDEDEASAAPAGRGTPAIIAAPGSRVWWCAGDGAILADGLWAGQTTFGAVVN